MLIVQECSISITNTPGANALEITVLITDDLTLNLLNYLAKI